MSDLATSTPSRRFRFSLRTLFLAVTLVAVVLGGLRREMKIVGERKACRAQLSESPAWGKQGYSLPYPKSDDANWPAPRPESAMAIPRVPFWREWLGDEPIGLILVSASWSKGEALRVKSLFPEACVWWNGEFL